MEIKTLETLVGGKKEIQVAFIQNKEIENFGAPIWKDVLSIKNALEKDPTLDVSEMVCNIKLSIPYKLYQQGFENSEEMFQLIQQKCPQEVLFCLEKGLTVQFLISDDNNQIQTFVLLKSRKYN